MLSFYQDDLGMKIVEHWDEPGDRGTLFAFGGQAGSTVIEVIELGNEAITGVRPVNIVMSIEVDDADAWHDELVKQGIAIARGLENTPWGHRSFGIDNPDGFRIRFYHDINKKTV